MGLLDKTNPSATLGSVLRAAGISAVCGGIVFFLAFEAQYVEAWRIALPPWVLLCAAVGAICEWQVSEESDEEEDQEE